MAKRRQTRWFWAWSVLATVPKAKQTGPDAPCEVWMNVTIVRARGANEAFRKAKRIGQSESGDSSGSLRLRGKPAICEFVGVANMGPIHDDLTDGRRFAGCPQEGANNTKPSRWQPTSVSCSTV